jgi:guanosine-3',5'-bis(diphosphate) 3'-pyrophosphohydrolase
VSHDLKGIAELLRAMRFAAELHRDQRRKGAARTPYVNHPIEVAETLVRVGGICDPVTLQAALLHDVVEDTIATAGQVEAEFGADVSAVVVEVSDDKSLEKQERKRLQEEHASSLSLRAKQVKLGDKICNVVDLARDPPEGWERARLVEYLDWTERVVAGCRGANDALEAFYDQVLAAAREEIP